MVLHHHDGLSPMSICMMCGQSCAHTDYDRGGVCTRYEVRSTFCSPHTGLHLRGTVESKNGAGEVERGPDVTGIREHNVGVIQADHMLHVEGDSR